MAPLTVTRKGKKSINTRFTNIDQWNKHVDVLPVFIISGHHINNFRYVRQFWHQKMQTDEVLYNEKKTGVYIA